jgi:hypothetical protein
MQRGRRTATVKGAAPCGECAVLADYDLQPSFGTGVKASWFKDTERNYS